MADDVTVQISLAPRGFAAPVFSVCGSGDGSQTCKVGVLKANENAEMQAKISVPDNASSGQTAILTATATGVASGATTQGSVSGIASIRVVAPPTSPAPKKHSSSSDHGHGRHHSSSGGNSSGGSSGGSGSGGVSQLGTKLNGDAPLSGLPPLAGATDAGSAANPGNLFPTINPSPSPSAPGSPAARTLRGPYHPSTVADILPLNTRQVGSQLAGLIVLAIGIAIAVVRVSLRKPRTQGKQ